MAIKRTALYEIKFDYDKNSLAQMQKQLRELSRTVNTELGNNKGNTELIQKFDNMKEHIRQISSLFDDAFNPNLGVANLNKINEKLRSLDFATISKEFAELGIEGQMAFNEIANQILTINTQVRHTETIFSQLKQTIKNSFTYSITSTIFYSMANKIRESYNFTVDLDKALNDIRVVTGKSSSNMQDFANNANKAARALGSTTKEFTEASLIYYQQGLSDKEVEERTRVTTMAANVTGGSASETSSLLTAIWNGYQVSSDGAEEAIDKVAAVAAATGADLEELSTGMSKVASAANLMGVDMDSLNAQIATIVTVTRQSAETVGTSLKTIYSRINDIESGAEGAETTLGKYTQEMLKYGINVLDMNGKLRSTGDVIEEIGNSWSNLTKEQKVGLSQAMAGTRQYNILLSMFENWGMYQDALNVSLEATGTLSQQNDIYLESTEAHLNRLKTATEKLSKGLFDGSQLNGAIDALEKVVYTAGSFAEALGGIGPMLLGIGGTLGRVFSKDLAMSFLNIRNSLASIKKENREIETQDFFFKSTKNAEAYSKAGKEIVRVVGEIIDVKKYLTSDQEEAALNMTKQAFDLEQKRLEVEQKRAELKSQGLRALGYSESTNIETLSTDELTAITTIGEKISEVFIASGEGFETLDSLSIGLRQISNDAQSTDSGIELCNSAIKDLTTAYNSLSPEQQRIIDNGTNFNKVLSELQTNLGVLSSKGSTQEQKYAALSNIITQLRESVARLNGEFSRIATGSDKMAEAMNENETEIQRLKKQIEELKSALKNLGAQGQEVKKVSTAINSLSALSQVSMGVSSLFNIEDIVSNDSISLLEKTLQVTSSLLISVPMAASGFNKFSESLQNIFVPNGVEQLKSEISSISKEINQIQSVDFSGAGGKGTNNYKKFFEKNGLEYSQQSREVNNQKIIQLGIDKQILTQEEAQLFNAKEMQTNEVILALQEKARSKEIKKQNVLQEKQNALKIFGSKIASAAVSLGTMAVISLAISLIVALVNKIKNLKTETEKLEAENKALQETYSQISESVKTFSSLLENYKEQIRLLRNLRKGTEDWKKAFEDVGSTIDELLEKYPALRDYKNLWAQDEQGNWILNVEALNEFFGDLNNKKESSRRGLAANEVLTSQSESKDATEDYKELAAMGVQEEDFSVGQNILLRENYVKEFETKKKELEKKKEKDLESQYKEIFGEEANEDWDKSQLAAAIAGVEVDKNYDDIVKETKEQWNNFLPEVRDFYEAEKNLNELPLEDRKSVIYSFPGAFSSKEEQFNWLNNFITANREDANVEAILDDLYSRYGDTLRTKSISEILEILNDSYFTIDPLLLSDLEWPNGILNINAYDEEVQGIYNQDGIVDELNKLSYNDQQTAADFINKALSANVDYDVLKNAFAQNWKKIINFDFENGSFEEFQELLSVEGEEINDELIPSLELLYGALHKTSKATDEASIKVEGIANALSLTQGGTISKDDFNNYYAGTGAEGYFQQTADGEYIVLGDPEQISKILTDEYATFLNNEIANAEAQIERLEAPQTDEDFKVLFGEDADRDALIAKQEEIIKQAKENQVILATTAKTYSQLYAMGLTSLEAIEAGEKAISAQKKASLGITQKQIDAYKEEQEARGRELSEDEAERELILNLSIKESFDDIEGDFEELYTKITDASVTALEKSQARTSLVEAINSAFSVDLDSNFFAETEEGKKRLNLFKKAIKGDKEALQELYEEATKTYFNGLVEGYSETVNKINSMELKPGQKIYDQNLVDFFNRIIKDAELTAAQIEGIFNGLQVRPQKYYTVKNVDSGEIKEMSEDEYLHSPNRRLLVEKEYYVYSPSSFSYTEPSDKADSEDKNSDKLDLFDSDINKYHLIEREIEKVTADREKLEKQSKRLLGKDLIKNLNEQNDLLEKQNELLKKKQEALKVEKDITRDLLLEQGATFDDDGEIANYVELLTAAKDKVVALQKQYNAYIDAGSSLANEELKQKIEDAQDAYEQLKDLLDEYYEIVGSIEEIDVQIQDNLDTALDNAIKAFKVEIDLKLDISDFNKKWREFRQSFDIDEEAFGGIVKMAEAKLDQLKDYYGEDGNGGIIKDLVEHVTKYTNGEAESVYGGKSQEFLDDVTSYTETLMDTLLEAEDLIKEIKEALVSLLDEASEKFDEQLERYEAYSQILEHDISLLSLIDGEERNYAARQAFYDKRNESNKAQLAFQKQAVEFWEAELEAAEEGTEAYQKAEESLLDAIESLNSALEESIEQAQEAYLNSINTIFEALENKITGGQGLDNLENQWTLIKDIEDDYLDGVNRSYELSKLEAKYRKAIDDTDSLSAQAAINDMMQSELSMLREKDKLSEYDIKRADLKYQLTLKQIELEEAQKNKSSMRLRRDASGNYSYEYVADQSSVSSLSQELQDLQNQIYNLDKGEYQASLDNMLSYWRDFQEAMAEAAQINDPEERARKEEYIRTLYSQKFTNIAAQNENTIKNLNLSTAQYIKDVYGELSSYEVNELMPTLVAGWNGGIQQMIDTMTAEGGFEQVCSEAWETLKAKAEEYDKTVQDLCISAGVSLEDLNGGYDAHIGKLQDLITKNDDVIESYKNQAKAMHLVLKELESYESKFDNLRQIASDTVDAVRNMVTAMGDLDGAAGEFSSDGNYMRDIAGYGVEGNWEAAQEAWEKRGEKMEGNKFLNELSQDKAKAFMEALQKGDEDALNLAQGMVDKTKDSNDPLMDKILDKYKGIGMATGGYTGVWANGSTDGKWAMLHQKELVLNAEDTANILKTVAVVRAINANAMTKALGMLNQIGNTGLAPAANKGTDTLEQNVHIEATFPNVSSADEIKEAFNSIITKVGQKIYDNKK